MKLAATLTGEELARLVAAKFPGVEDFSATKGDVEVSFTYPVPVVGKMNIDLEATVVPGGASP